MNASVVAVSLARTFAGPPGRFLVERPDGRGAWAAETWTQAAVVSHVNGEQRMGFPFDPERLTFAAFDVDGKRHEAGRAWSLAVALQIVRALADLGIHATLEQSRSGKGYHVWILFDANGPSLVDARELAAALLRTLGLVDDFSEKPGVVGFYPWPPKTEGCGRVPYAPLFGACNGKVSGLLCNVATGEPMPDQATALDGVERTPADVFAEALATLRVIAPAPVKPERPKMAPRPFTGELSAYADSALAAEVARVSSATDGERHPTLYSAARNLGELVAGGEIPRGLVESSLTDAAAAAGLVGGRASEVEKTIRDGIEKGLTNPRHGDPARKASPNASASSGSAPAAAVDADRPFAGENVSQSSEADNTAGDFYPADRPEIVDRKDPEVFREAEAALLAWPESGIYARGSLLVKIVRTGEPTFGPEKRKTKTVHRPSNAPAIAPVDPVFLCSRMGRSARWMRFVKERGEMVKVEADPPMRIARELTVENLLRFPALEGITEAPVFLPSGDVLERPGYDPETGLWYAPAADYPPVPSCPNHTDALRAAIEILEPFGEFPFLEDVDRAAFLAYVLTPLARTAIDEPAPMTSFDSPVRGSGKSKLATAGGTIGTGREPALMVPTDDEEELRKAALAFGLEGTRLCIIDNAAGAFGSKQLAAILTLRTISGRVLGLSKTATVPLRVVWAITGNNLTFKGDLARRVMHVRIDPKMEHPENRRDFKIPNLSAYVRDERARLVVAGLTILRAFHLAQRPHNGRPGRGFEAWCALVRSAVEWTIKTDPWPESTEGGDENDSEHEDLRRALLAWEETFGALPTTAAAACVRAAANPDLAATLAQFVGVAVVKLDARGLGFRIRHRLGQIADGRRFVRAGEDRIAGVKWAVRTTEGDA